MIHQLVDDLDGTLLDDDGGTVSFSINATAYEIDLSSAHADELRAALEPYIAVARRVGGRPAKATRNSRSQTDVVRAWARENGHEVSDRGRIPQAIMDAYSAR